MGKRKKIILAISVSLVFLSGIVGVFAWKYTGKTDSTPVEENKKDEPAEETTKEPNRIIADVTEENRTGEAEDDIVDDVFEESSGTSAVGPASGNSGSNGSDADVFSKLHGTLMSGDTLSGRTTLLVSLSRPDGIQMVQGGCVYGKYYYQAFVKTGNEGSVIVKYDLEKGQIIKRSELMSLGHTNDITYNSKRDRLVVCHNAPNRKQVSYIYPDTLELEKTFEIDVQIYSINYNEKMDRYVIGIAGGQTFKIVDSDFKAISPIYQPTARTKGYTTQGCACDDDYIYFVLYNQSVITVYDWSGNFVTLIQLDIPSGIEPENISIVNDIIYVGGGGGGKAVLYRVDI